MGYVLDKKAERKKEKKGFFFCLCALLTSRVTLSRSVKLSRPPCAQRAGSSSSLNTGSEGSGRRCRRPGQGGLPACSGSDCQQYLGQSRCPFHSLPRGSSAACVQFINNHHGRCSFSRLKTWKVFQLVTRQRRGLYHSVGCVSSLPLKSEES